MVKGKLMMITQDMVFQLAMILVGGVASTFLGLIVLGLKLLVKTVYENTKALDKLTDRVAMLDEKVQVLPKIEKDVNAAHEKIRGLEPKDN